MANRSIGLAEDLHAYLLKVGVREPELLRALRAETAELPMATMQIAPEEGATLAMLVRLIGARRVLEIGTFTGYSSTAMALALPADGRMVCCDVSEEWTDIARRTWAAAGVTDKIELRLAPALDTLDDLLANDQAGTFDLCFIDANKDDYIDYYERSLRLVRPGGVICIDNVLWSGRVADLSDKDERTEAIRDLNALIAADERVDVAMLPVADGLTLARIR
ncbi:MAG: class I SAM-dependent methyltransferase [Chloroflexota bacterium]